MAQSGAARSEHRSRARSASPANPTDSRRRASQCPRSTQRLVIVCVEVGSVEVALEILHTGSSIS
ncbi:hypothetical protein NJ7G_2566 [Natrinema sp. J7-2]|nr:hypothetical protein NJ7G_2566 [Natrinema sp. J7-2]